MGLVNAIKNVVSALGLPYFRDLRLYFSQDGEDIVLRSFIEKEPGYRGFYVDIGAHHPFRLSNTFLFYQKGWRGINVDAMPGSMKPFNRFRERDINIETGVGKEKGRLTFYTFDEPAINTFDERLAKRMASEGSPIIKTIEVPVTTLKDILDTYLPANTNIDFLSIDVEGVDYDVLLSNDWTRYKPNFILIELATDEKYKAIDILLKEKGYAIIGLSKRTAFYSDRSRV